MQINDNSIREHRDHFQTVTKYFSSGKLGKRIDKQNGTLEIINNKVRDEIRGSLLVKTIIKRNI